MFPATVSTLGVALAASGEEKRRDEILRISAIVAQERLALDRRTFRALNAGRHPSCNSGFSVRFSPMEPKAMPNLPATHAARLMLREMCRNASDALLLEWKRVLERGHAPRRVLVRILRDLRGGLRSQESLATFARVFGGVEDAQFPDVSVTVGNLFDRRFARSSPDSAWLSFLRGGGAEGRLSLDLETSTLRAGGTQKDGTLEDAFLDAFLRSTYEVE
jgi:hypothetical protein